ncbi:hypothetical protein SLEP1_g30526 [Rubroshorea leprosula]|uniref:Uncharacterized protein n=1 Tax=Rubroshorea leprosula TaxID=152421 RepID=A0AAV5K0C9_9ROSI|nr:hypothetical protein SLEP1_g30526 [Rubroshorea leprosula]
MAWQKKEYPFIEIFHIPEQVCGFSLLVNWSWYRAASMIL